MQALTERQLYYLHWFWKVSIPLLMNICLGLLYLGSLSKDDWLIDQTFCKLQWVSACYFFHSRSTNWWCTKDHNKLYKAGLSVCKDVRDIIQKTFNYKGRKWCFRNCFRFSFGKRLYFYLCISVLLLLAFWWCIFTQCTGLIFCFCLCVMLRCFCWIPPECLSSVTLTV